MPMFSIQFKAQQTLSNYKYFIIYERIYVHTHMFESAQLVFIAIDTKITKI